LRKRNRNEAHGKKGKPEKKRNGDAGGDKSKLNSFLGFVMKEEKEGEENLRERRLQVGEERIKKKGHLDLFCNSIMVLSGDIVGGANGISKVRKGKFEREEKLGLP